jgi:tape measure domain-containing protein
MAFEDLVIQLSSKLDESGFKALDKMETKAIKKTNALSNSMKRLFVGVMGTFAVKSIMDTTVKLDTLQRSFEALTGSKAGGESQLSFLRSEADRLGQSFETIANSYKNLFAAGKGAGWGSGDIQTVFSSILEAATVLGSSKQQVGGALTAIEQMISKGKVSMQELRQQLGNALPGAMQLAAKAMGVTSEELEEMLSNGMRSEEFVKRFSKTLHEEYGQKSIKASKSLRAELERLGNAIFYLQGALLKGDNMDGVADAVREITQLISSPVFFKSINAIGKLVAFLAKHIKLIVGIAVIIGFQRIWRQVALLRLELLTTTFAAGSLAAGMQLIVGGRVLAGLKTITAIFLAWLAPLLKIAGILGLIIEMVDTLRGEDTMTSEVIKAANQSKSATRIGTELRQSAPQFQVRDEDTLPYKFKKWKEERAEKKEQAKHATIIINANSADSRQVANIVRSEIASAFNEYEEIYGG